MLDKNGLLPPGLHNCTIDTFYQNFVAGFPSSQTREDLFASFKTFLAELSELCTPAEYWIDGSYVTDKINPNDIDIVFFIEYADISKAKPFLMGFKEKYRGVLDLYFTVAANQDTQKQVSPSDFQNVQNQRNYWRGQFGFDRVDRPKGIVCIGVRK